MLRFTDEIARQVRREGPGGILLGALFWSALLGLFCVVIIDGAARQIASAYRPIAEGTITVSELTGTKKNSWKLEYLYSIQGQKYTSAKFADDPMPIQGETEVLRHVAGYPVGATVAVYYDPDNPADAVIRPGLRGCTLWCALFLTPFVLVGVLLWWGGLVGRRWRPAFDPEDRRQVDLTEGGVISVRPQRTRLSVTFLSFLGLVSFLLSWVLAVLGAGLGLAYRLFDGFLLDPPVIIPVSVWLAVLVGCALATWRAVRRAPLLMVDTVHDVLRIVSGGTPAIEVPLAGIGSVFVSRQMLQHRKGTDLRYQVEVTRGDSGVALTVAEYDDLRDAEALANWLTRLLLPGPKSFSESAPTRDPPP